MPSYKDDKNNTWYCKFYYTDWTGKKRQKLKRGFKLQREAKEWERIFLDQFAKSPDITFIALHEKYKAYYIPRVKESTAATKLPMIEKHILPFFKSKVLSDIAPADIAEWQNEILSKNLSDTYMNQLNIVLSSVFNYAVDYVGLQKNPCGKKIGSRKTRKLSFWTPDEYKLFIDQLRNNIQYFTVFEILYYTGMREGELLALTLNDVDFAKNQIHINKTYYRITGKDLINTPKTEKGCRTIDIPVFLAEEIREYSRRLYKPDPEARLFPLRPQYIRSALQKAAASAGVKIIRVHDIRHSHASLLINLGANPVLVADRLGHESPDITLKIYSHLFPHSQKEIVSKIRKL